MSCAPADFVHLLLLPSLINLIAIQVVNLLCPSHYGTEVAMFPSSCGLVSEDYILLNIALVILLLRRNSHLRWLF
jgi:hypothetical protein